MFAAFLPTAERVANYALSGLAPDEALAFHRPLQTIIRTLRATDDAGNRIYPGLGA